MICSPTCPGDAHRRGTLHNETRIPSAYGTGPSVTAMLGADPIRVGGGKMSKTIDPKQAEEMAKKKPGRQQDANPPKKTSTDNPERNPRDQKGRGGSK
jgi:hypothetical protein